MSALIAGVLALLLTVATEPVLLQWLRARGVIDRPSARSSHQVATVRGGGAALVVAIVAASLAVGHTMVVLVLLLAVLWFGALGLIEDTRGVGVFCRLMCQAVFAFAVVCSLVRGAHLGPASAVLSIALGSIFVVAVVNGFNFMDGINGITGLNGLVVGGAYGLVASHEGLHLVSAVAVAISGAALGFLPFNLPRARVFLGDVGSYAVGGGVAAVALALGLAGVPVLAVVAPLGIYIADTGWTLFGRLRRHEPWRTPHRLHVYQQLVDGGLSHTSVSLLVAALTAVESALGAVSLASSTLAKVTAGCAAAALLVCYLSAPRWRRRYQSKAVPPDISSIHIPARRSG